MSEAAGQKADLGAWLAVAAGTIGSFMATLDTSIVNAALPTIQGEIGASQDEGTWITTAYLVAEIVMIPLAGWLDRLLGLRRFLLICTVGFVGFSMLCGVSGSLIVMIIGRVGQGFTGGAMIPTALTIVATRLPLSQRPIGVALFGATAVLGPVIGPVLGGFLTEALSWHYAFFINVPLGIGLTALLILGLPVTKADMAELRYIDPLGIIGLIMFLGALTTVLEEGQHNRWFESSTIIELSFLSAIGLVVLLVGQVVAKRPVIALSILRERAFLGVFVLSLVVGSALYGINYMLPQFLSTLADYNAFQSGQATMISGIPSVLMMLTFPILVRWLDLRLAVAIGLLFYAWGCLVVAHLTTDYIGRNFVESQILVGFGQFFALLFLNQAATVAVSEKFADDASGLFNAARNLGGSFGFSLIKTMREQRTWFHHERIAENMTANAVASQDYVSQASGQFGMGDPVAGMRSVFSALDQSFEQTGIALAYGDVFFTFGIIMIVSVPLVLLMRPMPEDGEVAIG